MSFGIVHIIFRDLTRDFRDWGRIRIRLIAASLGAMLIASSAEATVFCNADGTPQGCVWEPNGVGARGVGVVPGVGAGAAGVGVAPGVGVGARGVGVEPGVGVGRDGVDGEMNRGGR
jgi:hypothetical protein